MTETTTKKTASPVKPTIPAIYTALGKVMEGVANIPKTGQMKFGSTNYQYLKADDVQERLNPLLRENGIIVQPNYTYDQVLRGRGEGTHYVIVTLSMNYISTEDGSNLEMGPFIGESAGSDDKSINKALTQALKNANRVIFQFASGEPEADDFPPGTPAEKPQPRAVSQVKKATQAGSGSSDDLKQKIRDWIGSDDARRKEAQGAQEEATKKGLKGTDLQKDIIKALGIGG